MDFIQIKILTVALSDPCLVPKNVLYKYNLKYSGLINERGNIGTHMKNPNKK